MDNKAFKTALDVLCKEKKIDKKTIYDAMELALTSAYKKHYHLPNVRISIDEDNADIHVYSFKTVMNPPTEEELEKWEDEEYAWEELSDEEKEVTEKPEHVYFDERIHLTLEEARKIVPGIELGETIEEEVTPKDFGRVAAATAKQVVIQKIREAEKNNIIEEFNDKQDELITGIVDMEDANNYYVNLGRTMGILSKKEIIPGEVIKMGSSIKAYITKVDNSGKGPLILLSRTHYGFIKRLFELEIPEVNEGIVLIEGVAREAGNRTKVAVYSENAKVDAIGSCIGEKGTRIANILKELHGEKVDLVLYDKDASKFIANALSPAKNVRVFIIDEKKQESLVIVDNENLSLAIGKKGLNVKLAARLTHYKIDVKTIEQAKEEGINILEG